MPFAALARSFACITVCSVSAFAQIVVDPGGGGNFTDLQSAINAALPNQTILVRGGVHDPVTIDKSLNILGDPSFEIFVGNQTRMCGFLVCQQHAMTLAGTGTEQLTLTNAILRGQTNGSLFNESGSAIFATGFASIWLQECTIEAPQWIAPTGITPTRAAIDAQGINLTVIRSTILGQDSTSDSCYGFNEFDGGPAILAPGAATTILSSTVRGGNGVLVCFFSGPPTAMPCPCPGGGKGGAGVIADRLYTAKSLIEGGMGAPVVYLDFTTLMYLPWGRQDDGPGRIVNTTVDYDTNFDEMLTPTLGGYWILTQTCNDNRGLLFGFPLVDPLVSPAHGIVFLDPHLPFSVAWIPACESLVIHIPNDCLLMGLHIIAQEFSIDEFLRPHLAVLVP